ncbi:hypothetical protein LOCC1_G002921 [Lachnellula occidentalis]|uniref:Gamma-glutamylcyclotransferase AIG2-like domain-containing protein n=1 Tax=Lachnellula occidentalis TaxID=215460 RepID=A0A8H8S428_9HELO|nr:hypothetical protein LOCC1_G002921 [Lachnellula occidentalis]
MLERFQANVQPSLGPYAYIHQSHSSSTAHLQIQYNSKKFFGSKHPQSLHQPDYVEGMAYVVETEEQQNMLAHYETNVYSAEGIRVTIEGKQVSGRTFMWADDLTELTEGTWSVEEWKKGVEEEMASHFRPLED